MSYPVQYRKRAIEYRQDGHTYADTGKTFKTAISTLQTWEQRLKEKGNLNPKMPNRPFRKIDPEKLKAYAEQHPDACQYGIAEEFNCAQSAIQQALDRLGITRKKTKTYQEQDEDPWS